MHKHITLFLYFFILFVASAEDVKFLYLPRGTQLYKNFNFQTNPEMLVYRDFSAPVLETKPYRFNATFLIKESHACKIGIPNVGQFWVLPELEPKEKANHQFSYSFVKNSGMMFTGIFCFLASLFSIFLFQKQKSSLNTSFAISTLVLFYLAFMLYLIGATGNITLQPIDENQYFRVAKGLFSLDFSGQWYYTIGVPFFYLPFLFFFGTADIFEILTPFLIFSILVLMPTAIFMVFLIARKLSNSNKTALLITLTWLLAIFFYRNGYMVTEKGEHFFKALPMLPDFIFSYPLFDLLTITGYNALSDTLSMTLVLSSIGLLLFMKKKITSLVLFAGLFALACLTRINNILFTPLFVLFLYVKFQPDKCNLFRMLLFGSFSFFLVFLPQLVINWIQFGSPFRFPYVLHANNIEQGFSFSVLPVGIPFLFTTNHAYLVVGGVSLLFIKDRRIRTFFAWWIIPLLFFFCGFPGIYNNTSRFIMTIFPGCIATLFFADIWKDQTVSAKTRIVLPLLASVLLTAPGGSEIFQTLLPWRWNEFGMPYWGGKTIYLMVILMNCACILSFVVTAVHIKNNSPPFRKSVESTLFLLSFVLLFFVANPYLTAIIMVTAFCRAIYDSVILIRDTSLLQNPRQQTRNEFDDI